MTGKCKDGVEEYGKRFPVQAKRGILKNEH